MNYTHTDQESENHMEKPSALSGSTLLIHSCHSFYILRLFDSSKIPNPKVTIRRSADKKHPRTLTHTALFLLIVLPLAHHRHVDAFMLHENFNFYQSGFGLKDFPCLATLHLCLVCRQAERGMTRPELSSTQVATALYSSSILTFWNYSKAQCQDQLESTSCRLNRPTINYLMRSSS